MKNKRTNSLYSYLQVIGRYPLLSPEEEVELSRKIQTVMSLVKIKKSLSLKLRKEPNLGQWALKLGCSSTELKQTLVEGEKARKKMIKCNLRLVVSIAKQYQTSNLELLDLIQEGSIGLSRAVEKFNPERGYKFSTYSYWWIRQAISRAIANDGSIIRLPLNIVDRLSKIKKAQQKLSQQLGRTVTLKELANYLKITPDKLRFLLEIYLRSNSWESLAELNQKEWQISSLEDKIENPECFVIQVEKLDQLELLLSQLNPLHQEVIKRRFGIGYQAAQTLSEISQHFNVSLETIRQIEKRGMRILRKTAKAYKLSDSNS